MLRPSFATNSDKAWVERVVLWGSALWMLAVAVVLLTGMIHRWSDVGFMIFAVAAATPAVLGPMLLHRTHAGERRFVDAYWVKLNVWIAIVVAFGTYFGTHYFFDLMGMTYGFPVTWTLEARVVGRRGGHVPLFMYPLTHAYFMTYFVALQVALRTLRSRFGLGALGSCLCVAFLGYLVAFAETYVMATPYVEPYFAYADRDRMLTIGSFGYAVYFVIGVPFLFRIDEEGPSWSLARVALDALAVCMLVLCALEVWAQLVGPL